MTVAPDIIGRDEAKALGLKRYFTGKPCKHGHVAERYAGGPCVECIREQRREWRAANLEKARETERERARRHRAADPERVRENWRRWRAANLELARERDRERNLGQQAAKRAATKDKISKRQAAQAADAGSKLNGAGQAG
jgi:hypothetical protein